MIRLAICCAALAVLAGCDAAGGALFGSATAPDDMWSGPPPWTSTRDDSVEPRIYWNSDNNNDRDPTNCDVPATSSADLAVAVGLYEGVSLSSAAVGGPDQETNFVTVRIEPGTKPIYLVLSSYESMVWRLVGATDRVSRVVVATYHTASTGAPASGVIGVPEGKLSFPRSSCLRYFTDAGGAAGVLSALGGDPDRQRAIGAYSALTVNVPSGAIVKRPAFDAAPPPGFDAAAWRDAVRYWPGGVVMVPPKLVISPAAVRSYQVLPSQAGLAQLIGSGAIEYNGSTYRIVRPIPHVPPSMGGAHSVKLSLARGVPVPEGDLVHSCLVMEDGSAPMGIPQICERRGE